MYDTAALLDAMTALHMSPSLIDATLDAVVHVDSLTTVELVAALRSAGVGAADVIRIRRGLQPGPQVGGCRLGLWGCASSHAPWSQCNSVRLWPAYG